MNLEDYFAQTILAKQDPCVVCSFGGSRLLQLVKLSLLWCLLLAQLPAIPMYEFNLFFDLWVARSRGLVEEGRDFRSNDLQERAHLGGRGYVGRLG